MQSTLEGFDPIRAEPNGFPFHFLSHTDNVSYYEMPCVAARATLHGWRHRDPAFTFRHQAVPWKFPGSYIGMVGSTQLPFGDHPSKLEPYRED